MTIFTIVAVVVLMASAKIYRVKTKTQRLAKQNRRKQIQDAVWLCDSNLRSGDPNAFDALLGAWSDEDLAPWNNHFETFRKSQKANECKDEKVRNDLQDYHDSWEAALRTDNLSDQINKGSELYRRCTTYSNGLNSAPPSRCWPFDHVGLEHLRDQVTAKAQLLCSRLAEQAPANRTAYFKLAELMRKFKATNGSLYRCLKSPLVPTGNWAEWTARYLPEPSLADFGVDWGAVMSPYQVTHELQLRAAVAINTVDHVEAKLIRAYCFTGDYGYREAARENVGEILLADLARLVATYNAEHLEAAVDES